jgi:hypothetical protein
MTFDVFKKNFFPQHYFVQEDPDDIQEKQAFNLKEQIAKHRDKHP